MATDKVYLRHCILCEFQKWNNATVACANLCSVFGEDAVTDCTCQRWFSKFKSGDLSVDNEPHVGHPTKFDDEVLQAMLEEDPCLTSTAIGKHFEFITQLFGTQNALDLFQSTAFGCHIS